MNLQKSKAVNESGQKAMAAATRLSQDVSRLNFLDYVPWVYNPLEYAWESHGLYLRKYARSSCEILFLGMNPGPWGMAQTGVPFGEVAAVKGWLEIEAPIGRPQPEHPKRPVLGLSCPRSEVSGQRLWGLFSQRFRSPDRFFQQHFVANYCPLVFMEESARNVTPDKLPTAIRQPLEEICDRHLGELLRLLKPRWLIGVGAWAEACGRRVVNSDLKLSTIQLGRILHPSPASPAANRDWAGTATRQLLNLGVWK